jgi:mitochondrial fission protein ELM1
MEDRNRNKPALCAPPHACWCLSKGLAGMISQMKGLAQALGLQYQCLETRLRFPWTLMPTPLLPKSPVVLRNPDQILQPPPRVIISCGRHGVIPALWLKRKYGDQIFAAHIQDPCIDPSGFDMVIVPRHDHIRGQNVYLTTGAIHHITPQVLQAAAGSALAKSLSDGRPLVAVLVGGPNGYYSFGDNDLNEFVDRLDATVKGHNVRLVVLPSNRTPLRITNRLAQEFGRDHIVWNRQTENPYLAALAVASHIVVTGDSVSMVTEAAATGRPVFVQELSEKRRATRFRRFHQMFYDEGITRPFEGRLAEWGYEPVNDTLNIAKTIQERISNNGATAQFEEHNHAA